MNKIFDDDLKLEKKDKKFYNGIKSVFYKIKKFVKDNNIITILNYILVILCIILFIQINFESFLYIQTIKGRYIENQNKMIKNQIKSQNLNQEIVNYKRKIKIFENESLPPEYFDIFTQKKNDSLNVRTNINNFYYEVHKVFPYDKFKDAVYFDNFQIVSKDFLVIRGKFIKDFIKTEKSFLDILIQFTKFINGSPYFRDLSISSIVDNPNEYSFLFKVYIQKDTDIDDDDFYTNFIDYINDNIEVTLRQT